MGPAPALPPEGSVISTQKANGWPTLLFLGSVAWLLIDGLMAVPVKTFPPSKVIEWEERSFSGSTRYQLTEVDGREAIHAVCEDGAASALYHRGEIDLESTPVLEWSWRVDETFSGVDERVRTGDDFPARIYLVDERSVLRWRTRALNYVWSSKELEGADWPNPYTSRVHMISVRSGSSEEPGRWFTDRRNVQADFRRFHERELKTLSGLAIMTDCDDVGERAEAWYGTLRFVAEK